MRRELGNQKTGQHENTDGTHGEAMGANEKLTHERPGHATFDSRCEPCVRVRRTSRHPRRAVCESTFSSMPQSRTANRILKRKSCSATGRVVRRSQGRPTPKSAKIEDLETVSESATNTLWKHPCLLWSRRLLAGRSAQDSWQIGHANLSDNKRLRPCEWTC